MSERELVALILRGGRRGQSVLDVATAVLAEHSGLAGLARARPEELASFPGVGPVRAASLAAAMRLGVLATRPDEFPVIRSAVDVVALAQRELGVVQRERVLVFVVDAGNRVRRVVPVAEGSADRCMFPVREVLNAVLRHDGRGFALVHNHPSGDPEPSRQDLAATQEIAAAAKIVGLRFLDHVVVTPDAWRIASRPPISPQTPD